jgi:hypothetical protein
MIMQYVVLLIIVSVVFHNTIKEVFENVFYLIKRKFKIFMRNMKKMMNRKKDPLPFYNIDQDHTIMRDANRPNNSCVKVINRIYETIVQMMVQMMNQMMVHIMDPMIDLMIDLIKRLLDV